MEKAVLDQAGRSRARFLLRKGAIAGVCFGWGWMAPFLVMRMRATPDLDLGSLTASYRTAGAALLLVFGVLWAATFRERSEIGPGLASAATGCFWVSGGAVGWLAVGGAAAGCVLGLAAAAFEFRHRWSAGHDLRGR